MGKWTMKYNKIYTNKTLMEQVKLKDGNVIFVDHNNERYFIYIYIYLDTLQIKKTRKCVF
jgi:hypothetical protein